MMPQTLSVAWLQGEAVDAGVFAPHVPKRWGGLGLDMRGIAVVFEEAGYSLFGPLLLMERHPTRATCTYSRSWPARSNRQSSWLL